MLLNTFRDVLIVLCADCHIMIFHLKTDRSNGECTNFGLASASQFVVRVQELQHCNFLELYICTCFFLDKYIDAYLFRLKVLMYRYIACVL